MFSWLIFDSPSVGAEVCNFVKGGVTSGKDVPRLASVDSGLKRIIKICVN